MSQEDLNKYKLIRARVAKLVALNSVSLTNGVIDAIASEIFVLDQKLEKVEEILIQLKKLYHQVTVVDSTTKLS